MALSGLTFGDDAGDLINKINEIWKQFSIGESTGGGGIGGAAGYAGDPDNTQPVDVALNQAMPDMRIIYTKMGIPTIKDVYDDAVDGGGRVMNTIDSSLGTFGAGLTAISTSIAAIGDSAAHVGEALSNGVDTAGRAFETFTGALPSIVAIGAITVMAWAYSDKPKPRIVMTEDD